MKLPLAAVIGGAVLGIGGIGVAYLGTLPPPEVRIAGFATRLEGRTRAQKHNAELAARNLDGSVIAPGATFSFNNKVRGWSVDQGYVRAPVSFDGELIPAFGGGVCQTSTTLYNAALLAGLPIVERHHHVFAAHYSAPGRDAAVAYPNIDLRFRNPYPYPLRLKVRAEGSQLRVELWGKAAPTNQYSLVTRILSANAPETILRRVPSQAGIPGVVRSAGASGFRVVTYRVTARNGKELRRERLSDDAYPAMPKLIRFSRRD